ncbi:hypothetical protein MKX03_009343 [Papaver bracteatum]|nr:hypothetical protein MKX03_009343 [Papaver bracteatum]
MVGVDSWEMTDKGLRKGPWTAEEDRLLNEYVNMHGEGRWSCVAKCAGLNRSGKSCRLRWVNYLKPGLKKGKLNHKSRVSSQSYIPCGSLPGKTDNEIKNYWRNHFKITKPNRRSQDKPRTNQHEAKQKQVEETVTSAQVDNKQAMELIMCTNLEVVQCLPVMFQDDHENIRPSDFLDDVEEGVCWGGLWNMD